MCAWSLGHIQLFAAPWTAAHQAPLSLGFSSQEYGSGWPCPPSGDPPNPGNEPRSQALQVDSLPSEPPGKPRKCQCCAWSLSPVRLFAAPWTRSPPGSSAHGDSPGKNTGLGCHALLQGIFQPRDRTHVSRTAGGFFLQPEPPGKARGGSTENVPGMREGKEGHSISALFPSLERRVKQSGRVPPQSIHGASIAARHACSWVAGGPEGQEDKRIQVYRLGQEGSPGDACPREPPGPREKQPSPGWREGEPEGGGPRGSEAAQPSVTMRAHTQLSNPSLHPQAERCVTQPPRL